MTRKGIGEEYKMQGIKRNKENKYKESEEYCYKEGN
jgi:hypothetical protein